MLDKEKNPLVLITGSAGKIGTALCRALSKDYRVIGFDRTESECDYTLDITSEESVKVAFTHFQQDYPEETIAAVVHLAAYFDFTGEDSPLYDEVNVKGTKNLLKTLQNFKVERFIYSSTMLVHKPGERGERINENSKLGPKWRYPESKLETEKTIEEYHGNIPYLILRLAGLYDETSAVPTLSQQIARVYERRVKSHFYAGDLKAGQAFIHKDDLLDLFKKAIQHRKELSEKEVILAGEPDTVSYEKLQKIIREELQDEESFIITVPDPVAKAGAWLEEKSEPIIPDDFDQGEKPFIRPFMIDLASDHYALDISRARKALGWEPEHRVENVLTVLLKKLKQNPRKWYKNNGLTLPEWMQGIDENPEKVRQQYEHKIRKEHQNNIWAHFFNIALAFWLITSPAILGYQSFGNTLSDIVSGVFLLVFASLSLSWRLSPARWGCALVGTWVMFAPLAFWVPLPAAYLNDTLVGMLIFGFAVLVRPDIGVAPDAAVIGPYRPPGWDFTPSSWTQRFPIIILAFVGFFISRYLTSYQLGHISSVWEPFFSGILENTKNGTEEIITSYVSEAWPVPDAGLGAFVYMLEILTGVIGGSNRWRTMPWLVMLFGFMIVPLGIVSITFIIIQPIMLGTWCTLCLIAALSMLFQVPYSLDEIVATIQFLWRRKKAGRPVLRIFFTGDTDEGEDGEDFAANENFERSPVAVVRDILFGGITLPWNLLLCIAVGVWLMFTRIALGSMGEMADADHLIGSLVITFTIASFAETIRFVRFVNIVFGFLLFMTPFLFSADWLATVLSIISGLLLCIFSVRRGPIRSSYGSWNRYIV